MDVADPALSRRKPGNHAHRAVLVVDDAHVDRTRRRHDAVLREIVE